jgi:hypothetical protein
MRAILNQPYPATDQPRALRMAAAMGVFVAAFLLFFQPFGLSAIPEGKTKVLAICKERDLHDVAEFCGSRVL